MGSVVGLGRPEASVGPEMRLDFVGIGICEKIRVPVAEPSDVYRPETVEPSSRAVGIPQPWGRDYLVE